MLVLKPPQKENNFKINSEYMHVYLVYTRNKRNYILY